MTTQAQFQQLAAQGYNLIPVYRQRLADTDTPLSIFARLKQHQQAYPFYHGLFLLFSIANGLVRIPGRSQRSNSPALSHSPANLNE